jgi:hypothetical protein
MKKWPTTFYQNLMEDNSTSKLDISGPRKDRNIILKHFEAFLRAKRI